MLEEGLETEDLEGNALNDDSSEHSSDEDEQKEAHRLELQDGGAVESVVAVHDCSGSRPLLMDSDEDEHRPQLALQSSLHPNTLPLQSSTTFPQPTPSTFGHNQSWHVSEPAKGTDVTPDVFSKAPFPIAQEDSVDVFANAPFLRAPLAAQQQPDVFSQAPFGKRKEHTTAQPKTSYSQAAQSLTSDQGVLAQMVQQPFRPQALSKYSRHFEGSVLQQQGAAHRAASDVAAVPAGPLHSWTSEVNTVDPFVSAPFNLKAPQEKP